MPHPTQDKIPVTSDLLFKLNATVSLYAINSALLSRKIVATRTNQIDFELNQYPHQVFIVQVSKKIFKAQ